MRYFFVRIFSGPVCRGFMYISQDASYKLPYLTLCHLRALENCTIFDGTIVIDIEQSAGVLSSADVGAEEPPCLYRHLNNSFEVPKRLNSLIEKGGINVNHAGFNAELLSIGVTWSTFHLLNPRRDDAIISFFFHSRALECKFLD